jgi:uncharacterized membrane protein YdbT with pleckstrin-like domain
MADYKANAAFFRSRPLSFVLFGWLIIPLIYWFLKSKAEKVVVEDGECLYETGILSKERTELKLSQIRTVKVKQGLSGRIFGCGDVEIYTAGDSPEITAIGFPNPNVLRDVIKKGM